jgi:hypothetical protein
MRLMHAELVIASEAKQSRRNTLRARPWIASAPFGRLAMTP